MTARPSNRRLGSSYCSLALTLGIVFLSAAAQAKESDEKTAHVVKTVHPLARMVSQVITGVGTYGQDALAQRSISSGTAVEVIAIHVAPGEQVRRQQGLLTVAADPNAYLVYQQALSARTLANAELERLTIQQRDHLATLAQVETAAKALSDADAGVEAARRLGSGAVTEELRAPVDGIVTAINTSVGDRPAAGSALVTLSPLTLTRITVGVEPGAQRLLHTGDHASLRTVPASQQDISARVVVVGASLDKDTRLVPITLAIDEAANKGLLPGAMVEARIKTVPVKALTVPRTALVKDEQGLGVFEIVAGQAHRVSVTLLTDDGPTVSVLGTLDPAHTIVTIGAYELEDGAMVTEPAS